MSTAKALTEALGGVITIVSNQAGTKVSFKVAVTSRFEKARYVEDLEELKKLNAIDIESLDARSNASQSELEESKSS